MAQDDDTLHKLIDIESESGINMNKSKDSTSMEDFIPMDELK